MISTCSILTNFSQSNFDTDKFCVRPAINTNNHFFPEGEFMTHWVFLSKPVYDISSSLPKNCIIGQNKPQGCCAPSCPNTGIPQKKQLLVNWEASGLGSLEGLQPEDPGGLGRGRPERSDPPPAWQEVRGESQRAASPPHGQGGSWRCWGRGRLGRGGGTTRIYSLLILAV